MAVQVRWPGCAGVEIGAQGERVVIDPLADPLAAFAWLGERAHAVPLPEIVGPQPRVIAVCSPIRTAIRHATRSAELA